MREYLAKLKERRLQEARELDVLAPQLDALFALPPKTPDADRGSIRVVRGRLENHQALRALVNGAQRDLLLAPSMEWPRRARHERDILADAHARGVDVRILAFTRPSTHAGAAAFADVATLREREAQVSGSDAVTIAVADGEVALMIHYVPDDASTTRGKDVGLLVREQGLVRALRCQVEACWRSSPALRVAPTLLMDAREAPRARESPV